MIRIPLARAALAAAWLCAACGLAAYAQEPSASAVAAAKELVDLRGGARMFDPVVPGVVEQAKALFLQTNPALSKDLEDVAARLRADFAPRRAELANEVARIYAQRFSEQEMKEAIAFYKTSLGRKIVSEEPIIIDQSFARMQQWANKLSEEVLTRYRAEMKKKGHDL